MKREISTGSQILTILEASQISAFGALIIRASCAYASQHAGYVIFQPTRYHSVKSRLNQTNSVTVCTHSQVMSSQRIAHTLIFPLTFQFHIFIVFFIHRCPRFDRLHDLRNLIISASERRFDPYEIN